MNRISSQIGDRINTAFSHVVCPGCSKNVEPTVVASDDDGSDTHEDPNGERWSFIWRPPRGEVCPECSFPISRFAYRRKWIKLLMTGIVILTISALLFIVAMMSDFPGWLGWLVRVSFTAGIVTVVAGIVGIVIGGRHGLDLPVSTHM